MTFSSMELGRGTPMQITQRAKSSLKAATSERKRKHKHNCKHSVHARRMKLGKKPNEMCVWMYLSLSTSLNLSQPLCLSITLRNWQMNPGAPKRTNVMRQPRDWLAAADGRAIASTRAKRMESQLWGTETHDGVITPQTLPPLLLFHLVSSLTSHVTKCAANIDTHVVHRQCWSPPEE